MRHPAKLSLCFDLEAADNISIMGYTKFIAGLVLSAVVLTPAHAGMFQWMDDIFTFREDQKVRVMPKRVLPPKIVQTPTFDVEENREWSQYYSRQDVRAVDHLSGSSSKVIRPRNGATRYAPVAQPHGNGNLPGYSQGNAPVGYQAIQQRDRANRAQQSLADKRKIYLGEPDTKMDGARMAARDIGTKVGPPKANWRDAPDKSLHITPRPGDYDYRGQPVSRPTTREPGGREVARSPGMAPMVHPHQGHHAGKPDERYIRRNEQGQVDRYQVQPRDTLSGISHQRQIYGNWAMWPLIWDANRGTIKDPDLVHPRQQLDIPRNFDSQDGWEAMQRAYGKGQEIYLNDGR
jgi:nucleoid-associated protein YgaU